MTHRAFDKSHVVNSSIEAIYCSINYSVFGVKFSYIFTDHLLKSVEYEMQHVINTLQFVTGL